jgi:hypothetical protein
LVKNETEKMNWEKWKIPLAITSMFALIAFFYPYQVHIENALTLKPETNFNLQISLVRIVFEPILGLLLYFNRSFYALEEIIQLLFWMFAFFALNLIVKKLRLKEKNQFKSYFKKQLILLPVLIGCWFSFLVILIFIPQHNDQIINKSKNWVLVGTHSHTEYSHDGMISQENLWKWHKKNGFDAFFITEHNNHNQTLAFVNKQKNIKFSEKPVVFCGEEFSGSNHLSLLGLKSNFMTKGLSDSAVITKARADGAAILVNHWFDGERNSLEFYRDLGVDGYEIENTATDKRYSRDIYRRIKAFCEKNGLIMNGGLDYHGYASVCTLWNAFNIPGWEKMDYLTKESSILDIIKNRDQSKLQVLLLNDRPYYKKENLYLSPIMTLFNYFRTLNFFQIISWAFWILFLHYIHLKIKSNLSLSTYYTPSLIISGLGILCSVFLITLGLIYYSRIQNVEGFTEIYAEYSRILLIVGTVLLLFAGFAAKFTFYTKNG